MFLLATKKRRAIHRVSIDNVIPRRKGTALNDENIFFEATKTYGRKLLVVSIQDDPLVHSGLIRHTIHRHRGI
jgi:hypothetical protein